MAKHTQCLICRIISTRGTDTMRPSSERPGRYFILPITQRRGLSNLPLHQAIYSVFHLERSRQGMPVGIVVRSFVLIPTKKLMSGIRQREHLTLSGSCI